MVWKATRSFRVRCCNRQSRKLGPPSTVTSLDSQRRLVELVLDRRSEPCAASSQASILALSRRLITRSPLSPLDAPSSAQRLPHSRAFIERRPHYTLPVVLPQYTQARHTTELSERTRPHRACLVAWEMQTELTLGQEVARSGRHAGLL